MSGIRVAGLTKRYGSMLAVNNLNLVVKPGQFATLLGPSGCGKTTTLRCIAGLEIPDSGDIFLGEQQVDGHNRHVPVHQRKLGMVFQSLAVWPHMDVFHNVSYPLRIAGTPGKETSERTFAALELVGLGSLGKRYASELSGGQQQRVALARAIVAEPEYILYDEPLSSLDALLREQMRFELRALHDRLEITALYVTHDQQEAMVLSDQVHVLQKGEIIQSGTASDIYNRPGSLFVSEFLGSANTIALESVEPGDGGLLLARSVEEGWSFVATGQHKPGQRQTLVIRPHQILMNAHTSATPSHVVASQQNLLPGKVVQAVFLGDRVRYAVEVTPSRKIIVETVAHSDAIAVGAMVTLNLRASDCVVI